MLVYWSACILSMLFAWFGIRVKHKKSDTWYYLKLSFFAALPLIFIASVRYDVGRDYLYTYVPYFEKVQWGTITSRLEPLYHLLNVVVVVLNGEYPWVFAISAIIFFTAVYFHIFRDSSNIYLSIFLLVGTTYMFIFYNTMRQLIGCSILLFSLKYAREQKLLKFLLVVMVAACFHSSCLVFVPFYFFSNIKLKPAIIAIITAVVLFGTPLLGRFVEFIVEHTRYSIYIDSQFNDGEQGIITMLMNLAILAFSVVFSSRDQKYTQYCNLQMVAAWISVLSGEVVLINRIRWVFGLPCCILIPLALKNIRQARSRFLFGTLVVVLYLIYASYTIGVKNGNSVLPYQTIFSVI